MCRSVLTFRALFAHGLPTGATAWALVMRSRRGDVASGMVLDWGESNGESGCLAVSATRLDLSAGIGIQLTKASLKNSSSRAT
jgi:hypothetical protein